METGPGGGRGENGAGCRGIAPRYGLVSSGTGDREYPPAPAVPTFPAPAKPTSPCSAPSLRSSSLDDEDRRVSNPTIWPLLFPPCPQIRFFQLVLVLEMALLSHGAPAGEHGESGRVSEPDDCRHWPAGLDPGGALLLRRRAGAAGGGVESPSTAADRHALAVPPIPSSPPSPIPPPSPPLRPLPLHRVSRSHNGSCFAPPHPAPPNPSFHTA